MHSGNRRHFLSQVGRGMIAASIGAGLANDLGFRPACALEAEGILSFGRLEPLVGILQSTSLDKILPKVVSMLKAGTSLRDFVAAAALANGRAFGGEDYIGFHTLMALRPALSMAEDLPTEQAAAPHPEGDLPEQRPNPGDRWPRTQCSGAHRSGCFIASDGTGNPRCSPPKGSQSGRGTTGSRRAEISGDGLE